MSQEYVIPPGTEHVWTPPDRVVITPPRDDVGVDGVLNGISLQGLVRNQDPAKIENLSNILKGIWEDFTSNKISKDQLTEKLGNFRNNNLVNLDGFDDVFVQMCETCIVKMLTESNK